VKKEKNKLFLGPVIILIILTIIVMISSAILSWLDFDGQKTAIVNGTLETSLVIIKNIFTVDGIKYLFGNVVTNFKIFEPLVLLIIALIAISISETSGFIGAIAEPFKKLKFRYIILFTMFIGIISSFIGDYSYVILLPFMAIFYKKLGYNPIIGIITIFLAITLGYGIGVIYDYNDYQLGQLTELAATIDVDKNYKFTLFSNLYIMIGSTILLTILGTILIEKFLLPKIEKHKVENGEEQVISKKALCVSIITFVILSLMFLYMLIPNLFNSGILLDNEQEVYIAKLFSDTSPFKEGFIYIFLIIVMSSSWVYGEFSGNIKNSYEYSLGLSKNFEGLGYSFVLLFFLAQLIGILNWTNISEVITVRLVDFIASLPFSGIPLILVLFIIVIIISIFIPNILTKWILMSPLIVPLFMRSNINPDFTQFIFKVADGIGKSITPLFAYYLIMLALVNKYNSDSDFKVTVFGTMKMILPVILMITGLWLLIIIGWYIIGLPIGLGGYPTL